MGGKRVGQRRILSLMLLVCLGGEMVSGASQPRQPASTELLSEALQFAQRGQLFNALPALRQLNARGRHDELPPMWPQRLTFLLGLAYFQAEDYGKAAI